MKTVVIWHELPAWTEWYREKLSTTFPNADFRTANSNEEALKHAGEANAFVGIAPKISAELVSAMPRLEWVQSMTTGVDNLLVMPELSPKVLISKCVGIQGPQMSELALMMMLALTRGLQQQLLAQSQKTWDRQPQPLLHSKTLCILGLGSIAETLACYSQALGMKVTGVSGRTEAPHIDRIYPRHRLIEAAADADFLAVLIPLSPATHHIVGAEVLAAMKPSAFLINIARGGCVDEHALLAALESGGIAGAGIDVFETEPLPADSPLWHAPNTILSPHVGGFADTYHEQCFPTVLENMGRYLDGGVAALADTVKRA